jgi:hypothetical protein
VIPRTLKPRPYLELALPFADEGLVADAGETVGAALQRRISQGWEG